MTREKAIEILIAVAVCDRPILSCDFCARYAGIGTQCNYPTDEEIEESVLLLKGASNDMEEQTDKRPTPMWSGTVRCSGHGNLRPPAAGNRGKS